ncbi:phosphopantothenoylcysteine decarboxylase isoform X3 [Dermochelys coriacea]|uniref:phosphopantothenoylcysteine decarboxylase isoform X3 n=1 Tax=Dermochelys coriacea TaxID=27794 RepID=UPI001CA8A40D|nr:phosphopantothenoylcysteine decarboxylase isoform X3 [Dermochelys coriacea]
MAGKLRACFEIGQPCFFYLMLVTSMEDGILLLIAKVTYPVDTALRQNDCTPGFPQIWSREFYSMVCGHPQLYCGGAGFCSSMIGDANRKGNKHARVGFLVVFFFPQTCVIRAWDMTKPLLFCPAMNTAMWEHPITAQQVEQLKDFGYMEIPCVVKRLVCGDEGRGAMAEVWTIVEKVKVILSERDLPTQK